MNRCAPDDVFSDEHLNLQNNTGIEVLTFSRCTDLTLRRNTLAMLGQISSNRFRELNISFEASLDALPLVLTIHRSRLADLDRCLQKQNLCALEALTIGLPHGYPASLNTMEEFFPRTAARGKVRVMDMVAMERLVTRGKGTVSVGPSGSARVEM